MFFPKIRLWFVLTVVPQVYKLVLYLLGNANLAAPNPDPMAGEQGLQVNLYPFFFKKFVPGLFERSPYRPGR